jgi:hypothetical protein
MFTFLTFSMYPAGDVFSIPSKSKNARIKKYTINDSFLIAYHVFYASDEIQKLINE